MVRSCPPLIHSPMAVTAGAGAAHVLGPETTHTSPMGRGQAGDSGLGPSSAALTGLPRGPGTGQGRRIRAVLRCPPKPVSITAGSQVLVSHMGALPTHHKGHPKPTAPGAVTEQMSPPWTGRANPSLQDIKPHFTENALMPGAWGHSSLGPQAGLQPELAQEGWDMHKGTLGQGGQTGFAKE